MKIMFTSLLTNNYTVILISFIEIGIIIYYLHNKNLSTKTHHDIIQ